MRFWNGPQLLIVDLCRYRDYADIVVAAGPERGALSGFPGGGGRELVGIVSRPD
jgi:hypothetical protein